MKRLAVCLAIVLCAAHSALALPPTYTDEDSGWLDFVFRFNALPTANESYWSVDMAFFGKDITWIDNPRVGFGMTLAYGKEFFMFTIDSIIVLDPLDSPYLAFPIKAQLGVNIAGLTDNQYFYGNLSGGVEAFLGRWTGLHEYDLGEEVCMNLAASAGLSLYKLSPALSYAFGMGASTANAYYPSKTVYYY